MQIFIRCNNISDVLLEGHAAIDRFLADSECDVSEDLRGELDDLLERMMATRAKLDGCPASGADIQD